MTSGSPGLALILVNYRTANLCRHALELAAADLAGTGLAVEAHIVDNSGDLEPAGATSFPVRVHRPGSNLGYAGALNHAVSQTQAELLVVQNPDVQVHRGCLPTMIEALRGAAAVGPRLYWDRERRLVLPPTEQRGLLDESLQILAARGPSWAARARRRWRRHARLHWDAREPVTSYELSGAILGLRRDAWSAAGPMDPGYRLYFEEQDWLMRLRRIGLPALHLPNAAALHTGGRSVAQQPRAGEWFETSLERFRRHHHGRAGLLLLAALEQVGSGRLDRRASIAPAAHAGDDPPVLPLPGHARWVEISTRVVGFPAAAECVSEGTSRSWSPPADVWARAGAGVCTLTVTDAEGRELRHVAVRRQGGVQNRSVSASE